MKRKPAWFVALLLLAQASLGAEEILTASYAGPVQRYGHFALGMPHEYARLVARTRSGRELELELPRDEVFEDLAPRLVPSGRGAASELLAVVSSVERGSRLALIGVQGGALAIVAQSPAIGTPKRWLNPVGVADLDGDGSPEIAAVITPHIGGALKLYRRRGARLAEIASLDGFSNHIYGTTEQALAGIATLGGRQRLLVPDATRMHLRIIAFENGRLIETGRCDLDAPVTGPLQVLAAEEISLGLASGPIRLRPTACSR